MRLDRRSHGIGGQLGHGAAMEDLALDRSALHDDAHVAVERVDPGLEQRVDRGRNGDLAVAAVLAHHREHLLDEERVAGGGGRDPLAQLRVERRVAARPLHELRAVLCAERLEQERRRIELPAAPPRADVEQLRARDAEEEDRRVAREVGDVLHEIDEDRLRPLQVVDDDDLRPLGSTGFEQPAEGELRLGRRGADHRVGLDADREQDLDERPVGDPLPVREAPTPQDVGRVAHSFEEVGDEARLADPGRPEQREEAAGAVGDRVLVVAPEPLPLALASDERRLGVTCERRRRRGRRRRDETPRRAGTSP